MNVIAKYIPKKKSIQVKGFKEGYARNKKQRLKKSHAFSMTFERVENAGWLKGAVDLNEVNMFFVLEGNSFKFTPVTKSVRLS